MEIYLIYHSHIDNGYTERQERIARYQGEFIRQAVDCVLAGDPDFVFTAEGFWAVEQYLDRYGKEGEARLVEAVRTGRFELTAGYCHFAELLNERNLERTLEPCRAFCKRNGLPPPNVAMSADINGFSYGYAEILYKNGVRYLSTNINSHHGGAPLGGPSKAFYWRGAQGGDILCWDGLAYHKANLLGLIPGWAPVGFPGIPGLHLQEGDGAMKRIERIADAAESHLTALVESLERAGYPYGVLPLMGSGLYTDNSPVSDSHCALIREWNEKHGDRIRVRTATLGQFFARLEAERAEIPTHAGDWNDWWTDGVMSTPQEVRLFRNAQRTQALLERLDPQGAVVTAKEQEAISRDLWMYAEHTWGHSASGYAGGGLICQQLEKRKSFYAIRADRSAGAAQDKLFAALGEGAFRVGRDFAYTVVNPHREAVRCAVSLPVDYWESALLENGYWAEDEAGNAYCCQTEVALRGLGVVLVAELGPQERRTFRLCFGKPPFGAANNGRDGDAAAGGGVKAPIVENGTPSAAPADNVFVNPFYRLEVGLRGVDRILAPDGEVLTDGSHAVGQPVYERFFGEKGWAAGPGYLPRTIPAREICAFTSCRPTWTARGPVFDLLQVGYEIAGAARYEAEFRLYHELPRIELTVKLDKTLEKRAEGMYAALPFGRPDVCWWLDKAGAFCRTEDRLPGSCADYYNFQRGFAAVRPGGSVIVSALDVPLVMFGGLHLWEYNTDLKARGCAFSWLTNNKWETNFKSECAGCHESRYLIELGAGSAPRDCLAILEKNELEPVVLRK